MAQPSSSKDSYFYRAEKLTGNRLGVAIRHNKRTILKELSTGGHIDPLRSHLNYSLAGADTPKAVMNEAKALMQAAGIVTLRKDAVKGIETLFSLPVGSTIDHRDYFATCLQWTRQAYDHAPVLAADVHLDEAAPHCHIVLLPLIHSKMNGSDLMGGKATMSDRRNDFYEQVACRYGLTKPPKKQSTGDLTALYDTVIEHVRACDPNAVKGALWMFTRDAIRDNPSKAAQLLGIEIPTQTREKTVKLFSEYAVSTGAGAKTERVPFKPNRVQSQKPPLKPMNTGVDDNLKLQKLNHFDVQNSPLAEPENNRQTLSCVGFTLSTPSFTAATSTALNDTTRPIVLDHKTSTANTNESQDTFTESTTREREGSILATHWDYENGIFN